jgi:hypothetical protein
MQEREVVLTKLKVDARPVLTVCRSLTKIQIPAIGTERQLSFVSMGLKQWSL